MPHPKPEYFRETAFFRFPQTFSPMSPFQGKTRLLWAGIINYHLRVASASHTFQINLRRMVWRVGFAENHHMRTQHNGQRKTKENTGSFHSIWRCYWPPGIRGVNNFV